VKEEEMSDLFRYVDVTGDGFLAWEEFLVMTFCGLCFLNTNAFVGDVCDGVHLEDFQSLHRRGSTCFACSGGSGRG
jgi:hypothetical protein